MSTVKQLTDYAWYVTDGGEVMAGPFPDNATAWAWIDRSHGESKCISRRPAVSAGVKDRTAADIAAIRLVIRAEMQMAQERMLLQIEQLLREVYPEHEEIPD